MVALCFLFQKGPVALRAALRTNVDAVEALSLVIDICILCLIFENAISKLIAIVDRVETTCWQCECEIRRQVIIFRSYFVLFEIEYRHD